MTLEEIKASTKDILTAADIAPVLGCDPYNIILQAKQDAKEGVNNLGFNVTVVGTRVKIPRLAFLRFMGIF